MAKFAQGLGVDRQDLILEKQSRNTEDQARFVQPMVGDSAVSSWSPRLRICLAPWRCSGNEEPIPLQTPWVITPAMLKERCPTTFSPILMDSTPRSEPYTSTWVWPGEESQKTVDQYRIRDGRGNGLCLPKPPGRFHDKLTLERQVHSKNHTTGFQVVRGPIAQLVRAADS